MGHPLYTKQHVPKPHQALKFEVRGPDGTLLATTNSPDVAKRIAGIICEGAKVNER